MPVTELTPPRDGEQVQVRDVRFRTVGDITCTCPVESTAATPQQIVIETLAAEVSERGATPMDDKTSDASMEKRKLEANIRQPHEINDNLEKEELTGGEKVYSIYCGTCHQRNGQGASGRFPPLAKTRWVTGDKNLLISIVLKGMEGPIEVNGEQFNGTMPQHSFLGNEEIANVLTYIRESFGNSASAVTAEEVAKVRESLE